MVVYMIDGFRVKGLGTLDLGNWDEGLGFIIAFRD